MRVLIVEDEQDLQNILVKRLNAEHYSVDACGNGEDALDYINMATYDLIVLDIMIPGIDGLQVLQRLRADNNTTPVLLLTAKDTIDDRVTGLDLGADDYLVKPFDPIELVLRVKSLLKRYHVTPSNVIQLGGVTIDLGNLTVANADQMVELKKKECELLFALAGSPRQIFTRTQLIENIWGMDYEGDERTVDVHIKRLRERLEPIPQFIISTVRGLGYRLELA
ncbi:MAG TPA: DNA-binding response regulator [Paenibacillus sp.]|nr:DNA-binding response regulator [Paenibacillus sp.]